MKKVTFSTHCYEKDKDLLYANIDSIIKSHKYNFYDMQIVHQRTSFCRIGRFYPIVIRDEDYDILLSRFGIPLYDKRAEEISGGTHWYYKNHLVNHLAGLVNAEGDYIVFSDSDCIMVKNEPSSWIEEGIKQLESDPNLFVVSPSDGNPCCTQIMSQQLFLVNKKRLADMDWDCWDGNFIDGGPFKYYYHMTEGRIGMYMMKHNLYRKVLGDNHRYWHGPAEHPVPDEYKDAVKNWKYS